MKKKIVLILFILGLMVLLPLTGCTHLGNPYVSRPDDGYVMNDLVVTIDASKGDRSMEITEQFTFTFRERSRGYFRDFAINSDEKIRNIKVSGQDMSSQTDVEHLSGVLRVRVGDEERYIPTNKPIKSTLSYTMITPSVKGQPDTFYINAIGQGWSCKIEKATVVIKLPAKSNSDLFYIGEWGSDSESSSLLDIQKSADGKEITIKTLEPLNAFNGLTIKSQLPKGTFRNYADSQIIVTLIVVVIILSLAVLFKLLFSKSAPVIPISTFYPPKDMDNQHEMSPLELGYLIDNTCSGSDVTSLIFYWASKGYLELEDADGTIMLYHKKDVPSSSPKYEQDFFNKIFSSGREVSLDSLTNKTYQSVENAKIAIKRKYSGKLYHSGVKALSFFMAALICVSAFAVMFFSYRRVSSNYFNFVSLGAIIPVVLSNLFGAYLVNNWIKLEKKRTFYMVLFVIATVLASLILVALVQRDVMSTLETTMLMLGVAFASIITPFISKRTDFYSKELGEVVGFRDFLQYAEKDRLEALLQENPQYYYDILPYANVLGVSDIWENKFASLTMQPPVYYRGVTLFDLMLFNSFFRRANVRIATVAISRPSSSSRSGGGGFGGGGGGGGFSGGGFGGGGGGRW